MTELDAWLEDHELDTLGPLLKENGFEQIDDMMMLTPSDLGELGVNVKQRNRLFSAMNREDLLDIEFVREEAAAAHRGGSPFVAPLSPPL